MADPIKFDRKPYTISYVDNKGDKQTIRRVPPPKLHVGLPGDKVDITTTKSDDFRKGDSVSIKHINPRHPNVVQVQTSDGRTTFLNFNEFSVNGVETIKNGAPNASVAADRPIKSNYLLWP